MTNKDQMNTLFRIEFLAFFLIVALIFGCSKDNLLGDCIQGEGAITTRTLSAADFNGVGLDVTASVTIKQGATQEVIATGHPNILDAINISATNNYLEIDLEDGCYQYDELSFVITIPDIESLNISGSGIINVEDFTNQNELYINISGSGTISLNRFDGLTSLTMEISGSGKVLVNSDINNVDSIVLALSGSGLYSGFAISSKSGTVNSSGSGMTELTTTETLDVIISGSGTVSYKGSPTITQSITGSGELIDAN